MGGSLDPDAFFDLFLADLHPPDEAAPADAGMASGAAATWRGWWSREAARDPGAARTGFVLDGREAAARGRTRSQVRTAVDRGRWQDAGRGLSSPLDVTLDGDDRYVVARRRHALLASGASRRRPREVIAGRSAAILHGLPTFRVPDEPELLLAAGEGSGRLASGHLYAAGCSPSEVTTWFGRPVTTVERTLVDLGRHDRFDAIMAADAALREGLTTERAIRAALGTAVGWPGVRQARAVLALADPLAESPLESLTRLRMHDDGLPAPDLQVWIGRHRVDFYWPRWRFVLEVDGRVKYTADERWAEKTREQALRRQVDGLRVERAVWHDLLGGWPETLQLLHSILDPAPRPLRLRSSWGDF